MKEYYFIRQAIWYFIKNMESDGEAQLAAISDIAGFAKTKSPARA